jgi:hypothetical protein
MTRECRCTAKPLAIDSEFFIVIPGIIHFVYITVFLLGATAQDFAGRALHFFLKVSGAEVVSLAQLPSYSL